MGRQVGTHKKCRRCEELKPRTEFTRVTGLPNAVQANCKACNAEITKGKRRKLGKQAVSVINRRSKLKRNFGLSLEDYEKILASQNGKCAICGTSEPGGRGSFAVDHCHQSEVIRGLLCNRCNVGLGHFNDDPHLLLMAVDYIIVGGKNHGVRNRGM